MMTACCFAFAGAQEEAPPEPTPAEVTGTEAPPEANSSDPAAEPKQDTWRAKWRQWLDATRGLATWDLFDGRLTLQGRVRLNVDGTIVSESDLFVENFGTVESSIKARRVRLSATGTIDRHLRYVLSFDLGVDRGLKNAYVEGIDKGLILWGYDVGQFRLGSFKEPFSLDRQAAGNDLGMMEWALPVSTFGPGRNIGYMLHDTAKDGRLSWAAGFFSFGSREEDNASSSTLSVTGRLTGLPLYRDEGRSLLHVGIAFSSRDPRSGELQYRARPEARFVPFLLDTGTLDASGNNLLGLELAGVRGPAWFQSELIVAEVQTATMGDLAFWGAYGQAGFFITGESRPYKKDNGAFGRVVPRSSYENGVPFKRSNGGALELTARYSYLDLNDGDVRGGKLRNVSAGVNWYLNETSRVMLNFIRSKTDDQGSAKVFLLRYQYNPR